MVAQTYLAYSDLLTEAENHQLNVTIGTHPAKLKCLTAAVAQYYLTRTPAHNEWHKKGVGILTLLNDCVERRYVLRMYSLYRPEPLVEDVLDAHMEYKVGPQFFHTYQTQVCFIAFNFTCLKEAGVFAETVTSKIAFLKKREHQTLSRPSITSQAPPLFPQYTAATTQKDSSGKNKDKTLKKPKKSDKKVPKRRLTLADIGKPSAFRHLEHAGINGSNFKVQDMPEQLQMAIQDVNITDLQLRDPEVLKVIKQVASIIHDKRQSGDSGYGNGGNDNAPLQKSSLPRKSTMKGSPLPAVPPRQLNTHPSVDDSKVSPTIGKAQPVFLDQIKQGLPAKNRVGPSGNKISVSRQKTQGRKGPVPPVPVSADAGGNRNNSSSSPTKGVPTPPPPPVMGGGPPPPPPPPPPPSDSQPLSSQNLAHGTISSKKAPVSPGGGDGRGALLEQIRLGKQLKSVAANSPEKTQTTSEKFAGSDDLARQLILAIERRAAIQDDSDDSTSDSEDEEWDA